MDLSESTPVTIFNDFESNYTTTALTSLGVNGRRAGISAYFEGSNIIVYIRGTEDEEGDWWNLPHAEQIHGKGGVLVNAHFDSVSTGYGATDDGMGVVTILQLIRYFTAEGNTPKKGLVCYQTFKSRTYTPVHVCHPRPKPCQHWLTT